MEKTIASKNIYNGKVVNLRVEEVELENGSTSTREIISHTGGCAVIARRDDKIVFVRQYRKPIEKSILELPAGKLEIGEDPILCAKRELKEETGYLAENIVLLGEIYTSPGYSDEVIYIYYADHLIPGSLDLDPDELVSVKEIEIKEVFKMVKTGEIKDGKTLAGLAMAQSQVRL